MNTFRIEAIQGSGPTQILPGEGFWFQFLDLPNDLSATEIAEAIEIAIDSISPFPADRRVSGWYPIASIPGRYLLYAASRGRMERLGAVIEEDAAAVVPAFLPAMVLASGENGEEILLDAIDCGGFALHRGESGLRLLIVPPAWDHTTRQSHLQAEAFPSIPDDARALDIEWTVDREHHWSVRVHPGDQPGLASEVRVPDSVQPWADLRGPATIEGIRKSLRQTRRLKRITFGLAAALVVSAGAQLFLYPFNQYVASLRTKSETLSNDVAAMDARRELVLRLEKLAAGSPPPLEWLAIANAARPDSIEWDEALVTADGVLEIEGRAPDIASVNNYASRLREGPSFTDVQNEATAREGRIAFDLRLSFNP